MARPLLTGVVLLSARPVWSPLLEEASCPRDTPPAARTAAGCRPPQSACRHVAHWLDAVHRAKVSEGAGAVLKPGTGCIPCIQQSHIPAGHVRGGLLSLRRRRELSLVFAVAGGPAEQAPAGHCFSGLSWTRPPVPTELISVLILHTGSVQQEQESSP